MSRAGGTPHPSGLLGEPWPDPHSMFRPSPRLGPEPSAPDSSPDRQAAHYERRLLLAQALGDSSGLKEIWQEYWQFLQGWQAAEQLQTLIPGMISVSTPVVCTAIRERSIRDGLHDARSAPGAASRNPVVFAFAWYTVGEYDKALVEIEMLSMDGELDVELEVLWALCLVRLKHWAQAFEWFEHAATRDPKSAAARAGMGYAMRSMGRPKEALVQYRQAARLDPTMAEVHFLTGDALNCLELYGKAHQAFNRAVRRAPENQTYRKCHEEALRNNGLVIKSKASRGYRFRFGARKFLRGELDAIPSIAKVLTRAIGRSKRKKHASTEQAARKRRRRKLSFWGLGGIILLAAYFATPHDPPGTGYGMAEENTAVLGGLSASLTN